MFFFASENTFLVASLLISLICFLKHKENIKRLINRSEVKI
jgi:glycerol-3-phosphate acyltransferase PlsY